MHLERLIDESSRWLSAVGGAGGQAMQPMRGLLLLRQHASSPYRATLYEPVVCLVLQGRKEVMVGDRLLSMSPGECLLVSHDLPVRSRVTHAPYLALVMEVDIDTVRELNVELGDPLPRDRALQGACTQQAAPALIDALHRYLGLAGSTADAKVLAPLVFKEIHFRLLTSTIGLTLRSLARLDSRASAIAHAIRLIQDDFQSPLSVADLACRVGMSPSAFHKHFQSITSTSPLQYLKEVRLLQAQRRLRAGCASVMAVAFDVGYASPSQFSRDYSRKFGVPPSRESPDPRGA